MIAAAAQTPTPTVWMWRSGTPVDFATVRKGMLTVLRPDAAILTHRVTCQRCGGAGGWKGWPGFTCYECGGKGSVDAEDKLYTAEKIAKLDAAAAKRNVLASEKRRVTAEVEAAALESFMDTYYATHPDIAAALDDLGESSFATSLRAAIARYGNLTERQAEALLRIPADRQVA